MLKLLLCFGNDVWFYFVEQVVFLEELLNELLVVLIAGSAFVRAIGFAGYRLESISVELRLLHIINLLALAR